MNLPDEKREELRAAILDWPNAAWLRLPGPVDLTPDLTRHLAPLLAGWLAEADADHAEQVHMAVEDTEARVRARVEALCGCDSTGCPCGGDRASVPTRDLRAALDADAAETSGGGE